MNRFSTLLLLLLLPFVACEQPGKKPGAKEKTVKVLEGMVQHHYTDGTLASEITYKDSKKHGYARGYFKSGKLQGEFNYENDILHGLTKLYWENGNLFKENPYTQGELDGVQKLYRQSGELLAEVPYKMGELGLGTIEYGKDGKPKTKMPKLIIEHVDNLLRKNEYTLRISLSDKHSKTNFYLGELKDGKYLSTHRMYVLPKLKGGVAEHTIKIPPGAYLMETLQFIAETETKMGVPYLVTKKVNVALENKGY